MEKLTAEQKLRKMIRAELLNESDIRNEWYYSANELISNLKWDMYNIIKVAKKDKSIYSPNNSKKKMFDILVEILKLSDEWDKYNRTKMAKYFSEPREPRSWDAERD